MQTSPVLGIRSILVKEYNGKATLTSHDDTQIIAEPQHPLTDELKKAQSCPQKGTEIQTHKTEKEFVNYRVTFLSQVY